MKKQAPDSSNNIAMSVVCMYSAGAFGGFLVHNVGNDNNK